MKCSEGPIHPTVYVLLVEVFNWHRKIIFLVNFPWNLVDFLRWNILIDALDLYIHI